MSLTKARKDELAQKARNQIAAAEEQLKTAENGSQRRVDANASIQAARFTLNSLGLQS